MTETPAQGNVTPGTVSGNTPDTTATTPTAPTSGGTGNPADAAPVQGNPTDSSSVSDSEGVQALSEAETTAGTAEAETPDRSLDAQEAEEQAKRDEVAEANAVHQERVDVDHEGTGPGDTEGLPPSEVEDDDTPAA